MIERHQRYLGLPRQSRLPDTEGMYGLAVKYTAQSQREINGKI
jgi:hypothetical protein